MKPQFCYSEIFHKHTSVIFLASFYYTSIFTKMKAIPYTSCPSKRNLNREATSRCFMLSSVSLSICPFSMLVPIFLRKQPVHQGIPRKPVHVVHTNIHIVTSFTNKPASLYLQIQIRANLRLIFHSGFARIIFLGSLDDCFHICVIQINRAIFGSSHFFIYELFGLVVS